MSFGGARKGHCRTEEFQSYSKGRPLPRLCYSMSAAALLLVAHAPSGLWQCALPLLQSSAVEGGDERREEEEEEKEV